MCDGNRQFPARVIAGALIGVLLWASASTAIAAQTTATTASQAQGLRIVVLEGEDAVNIIQQRTAVAPIVEVRDRNDQPVAGAVVRFAIRAGRGSFNGARTLTVTTNTAGRAVAAGFTPSGTGAMQIGATATFQGQTAAVTIAQTNVLTAAQAATAASGAGGTGAGAGAAGSGAAGGGAGGAGTAAGAGTAGGATAVGAGAAAAGAGAATGGGIGLTTIGIIGAAAAGGTYAVTRVLNKASSSSAAIKGSYSAQLAVVYTPDSGPGSGCTRTFSLQGSLTFDYVNNGGTIQGDFDHETDETVVATTCTGDPVGSTAHTGYSLRLTGAPGSLSGSGSRVATPLPGATETQTFQFNGSLADGVLTGTFTQTEHIVLAAETGNGIAVASVTLR